LDGDAVLHFLKRLWPHAGHNFAVRFILPATTGLLFGVISFAFDFFSPQPESAIGFAAMAKHMASTVVGAMVTTVFIFVYNINALTDELRNSYLKIPWLRGSDPSPLVLDRIRAGNSFTSLMDAAVAINLKPQIQSLALQAIQGQMQEQARNIRDTGRLQFIKYTPSHREDGSNKTSPSKPSTVGITDIHDLGRPGYEIIEHCGESGDLLIATDFANSQFWWLSGDFATYFFRFNLSMLSKGLRIQRVFGINHAYWREQESGPKAEVMQLLANLEGCEIYTIEYKDFSTQKFGIAPMDCMLLARGSGKDPEFLAGIEWELDRYGATSGVYHVFGHTALTRLMQNFNKILQSKNLGSTLRRVERRELLRLSNPAEVARADADFCRIIERAERAAAGSLAV
jgi:hypothetical protein